MPVMTGNVAGVLLAAGLSSRMGRPKQLAALQGKALVRWAAEALLGAPFTPWLAVIPPGETGERIREVLSDLPFQYAVNPQPQRGMLSSFQTAELHLPDDLLGVNFALADMPLLTPSVHRAMLNTFLDSPGPAENRVSSFIPLEGYVPLVMAEYGETEGAVRAPPHLFRRDVLRGVHALPDADRGPRELGRRYAAHSLVVRFPAALLLDIDTPQALAAAEEQGWAQM